MNITMQQIGNELGWQSYINNPECSYVLTTHQLFDKQSSFESTTLYVVNLFELSAIQSVPASNVINLLCVDYCNIPGNIPVNSNFNLLFPPQILKCEDAENQVLVLIKDENHLVNSSIKLYEALASGKGIQHITNVAFTLFDNPILVSDNSFKLLAHSEKIDTNNELLTIITSSGYFPKDYIQVVTKDRKLYDQIYHSKTPAILSDSFAKNRYICSKININGKPEGFITIIEYIRTLTQRDLKLFKVLCKVISSELRNGSYIKQVSSQKYEYFIVELLSGPIKKDLIKERLEYLGLKLKSNLFILTARFIDENTQKIFHLQYLRDILEKVIYNGKCVIYHNSLVMLISQDNKNLLTDRFLSSVSTFLTENYLIAGISHCFHEIENISNYYNQACEAIRIGRRLDSSKRLYNYELYSFYYILDIVGKNENLKNFCDPKLLEIIDYDHIYHTNYALTTYTYLSNGLNPTITAQQLNIHRNTIDYRINKVQDLFNVRFNDAEITFSFNVSFRILMYSEGLFFTK